MSAQSIVLWCLAVFFAFSGAMMLVPRDATVSTLEQVMGPVVETDPL